MTPKELKNSILQLAIEGKLVEQRNDEGTAQELFDEIKKEKEKLIKEGKIKKEKELPEITDDEIPFEIPKSWKWCRMIDIMDIRDGTHDSPKYVLNGIPLVTSKNLIDGSIDYSNIKYISEEDANNINARSYVDNNDILFAMIGSIGNPVIVNKTKEFCIKNMALFKIFDKERINVRFIWYYLLNIQNELKKISNGGVQQFVSLNILRNYFIPLPPLSEQRRIVEKIEQLLPLVDRYEELYNKLNKLDEEFPDKLKNSILQKAIEGKLVMQDEADGSAETLYEEIQKEKQKLIKEGKIKKEKELPEITDDEIPFEIPKNWKWCRISECFEMYTGDSIAENIKKTKYTNLKEGYNYIGTKDISFDYDVDYINGVKIPYEEQGFKIAKNNSILMCIEGGSAGRKIAILKEDVCFGNKLCMFNQYKYNNKYLYYYLQSAIFKDIFKANLTGIIGGVSIQKLKECIFPLPPLPEQHRIVDKIEELLPYIDRLKTKNSDN